MVLDHVAGGADAVVVAGAAADADVLGHGDLHVVDVVAVPDRLEQLVGEAQRQHVLDGLLAQVVVDPEHRRPRGRRR